MWITEKPEIPDDLLTFSRNYQHAIHNGFMKNYGAQTSIKSLKTKVINNSTTINNTITNLVIFVLKEKH